MGGILTTARLADQPFSENFRVEPWLRPLDAAISSGRFYRFGTREAVTCDKSLVRWNRESSRSCKPSPGAWSMAERWLFPASPRPHSRSSPRSCKNFFRSARSSSHGKFEGAGKFPAGFGNMAGHFAAVLSGVGNRCRMKASSARRCHQRPLHALIELSENSKLKIKNSKLVVTNVTALLQKLFRPVKFRNARARLRPGWQNRAARLD